MLKLYMGYSHDLWAEYAVLVFAHNTKEAKKVAFGTLLSLDSGLEYINVRVRRIYSDAPHLWDAGDPKKIFDGTAHAIDNPQSCANCEMWGSGIVIQENGWCSQCNDAYGDV